MADDIDRAQERAEILRDEALSRAVSRLRAPCDPMGGDGTCADCGDDIPVARLAALDGMARRCVDCERDYENALSRL